MGIQKIDKERLEKVMTLAESLSKHPEKSVRNCSEIIKRLLLHIEDLYGEFKYLEEQVEFLEGELVDKRVEKKQYKRKNMWTDRLAEQAEAQRPITPTRVTRQDQRETTEFVERLATEYQTRRGR